MPVFFNYERDSRNRPMITRCILLKDGKLTFGQAICSDKENPVKRVGRAKALGRAIRAFERKMSEIGIKNNKKFFKYLSIVDESELNEPEKQWLKKQQSKEDS